MPPSRDPHAGKSLRLLTLGSAVLVDANETPVVEQRRRIALLALVACSGSRGISRDKLIAYLNPDSTTDSARHALHQLLYYLRQQVDDELFQGTDPLRLNPSLVTCDVTEFDEAYRSGRLEDAAGWYRGPFLDGFHLPDSGEFEDWVSGERAILAARYRDILRQLVQQSRARGDHVATVTWSAALAAQDPLSASAALEHMRALADGGDRAAAMRYAQTFQHRFQAELGSGADADVEAYLQTLRATGVSFAPRSAASDQPDALFTLPLPATPAPSAPAPSAPAPSESAPTLVQAVARPPETRIRYRWAAIATAVLGVVGASARMLSTSARADGLDRRGVAILPVANLAGDSLLYLARGIEEVMIARLSRMSGLTVTGANVMRQFDAPGDTGAAMGRHVDAAFLLQSRLRRERDTVWLLLDVLTNGNGARLGGGRFALTSPRMVSIESAIIDSLALALGIPRVAPGITGPRDPEAYLLVMRASYLLLNRNQPSLLKARDLLIDAIERDPTNAEAHSRLAEVYGAFAEYGVLLPEEAMALSRASTQKALSFDPTSATALASLAFERGSHYWQWDEAISGLRQAATMEPWRATTWNLLGTTLRRAGRFDEALAAAREARHLDPLARHYTLQVAQVFLCAGQLDSALIWTRKASAMNTRYTAAREMAAEALVRLARYDEAIAEWRAVLTISGDSTTARLLDGARGQQGWEQFVAAKARLNLERNASPVVGLPPSSVKASEWYAQAGDTARALSLLERGVAEHHPNIGNVPCRSAYAPLRESPRFKAIMRSVNLTEASYGAR